MIQELRSMFKKQAGVEKFDLIQSFHACKQEEGKPVADYVLKMKGYVEQLECLGYVLPQDVTVGLILNGLTKDFVGFVRNYNMHNMGKTIGEIHAMLIEYEKGLPKKAETPQVMMIKSGKIQKANKKSLKAKGKNKVNGKGKDKKVYIPKPKNPKPTAMERPAKDDVCHHYNCHYAPSITRGVVSVHRLVENGFVQCFTDFGISVSKNNVFYFNAIHSNGIYEIDMHDLVPNDNSIYNVSTKRAKHNLNSTYLWHCRLTHINKKRIKQLQQDGLLKSTDDESFDQCVSRFIGPRWREIIPTSSDKGRLWSIVTIKAIRSDRGGEYISQEFKDYLKANGIIQQLTPPYTPQQYGVSERRNRTLLDMVRSMMNFTTLTLSFWDYALGHGDKVEALVKRAYADKREQRSVKAVALEEIQEEEDTTPSEITSNIPQEVEGFEPPQPPQEEEILIRRSERTRRVPNRLCLNVEVEEHSLGNLNEPTSYKATRGWVVHGFLRKKTDMDGIVHVYKARLVAKGYTQLYGVDYEERKVSKLQRSLWVLKQALNEAEYKRFDEGIKRDLGETNLFLESKSHRDRIERRFIGLSQMPYMDKILKRYKMDNSKRGTIPMQERLDLNKSQGAQTPKEVNRMKNVPYASAVRIHRSMRLDATRP
ncbi:retrotransposon protein, putative, ty1-copia subclass [Tanacetum coccineum]|uniref:Retrotransposon protein, putative, ty1-copia subclass n=1 Tax=Tanacetum coccineum TaxID=301880 RepID=A0ABQ5DQP4_9ASTR